MGAYRRNSTVTLRVPSGPASSVHALDAATGSYADQVAPPSFEKRISFALVATPTVNVTASVLHPAAPSLIETVPVPTGGGAAAARPCVTSRATTKIATPNRATLLTDLPLDRDGQSRRSAVRPMWYLLRPLRFVSRLATSHAASDK